ncbi:MAG: hypothetical protein IKQ10_02730 [Oscillospiraceae bacterium]|nr:hypothetical protein [Oscillospiraceae bacterium]
MTIREVLSIDAQALEELRIPIREAETCKVIAGVVQDLKNCVEYINRMEQEAKQEQAPQEEPKQEQAPNPEDKPEEAAEREEGAYE